jgi:hypothetical protein
MPEPNPEPVYVVTAPPDVRGIYDLWKTVDRLQHGRNICQMLVWGREGAKAVLDGRGVVLGPGLHGFTDGNASGGVGVVLVEGPRDDDDPPMTEIAPRPSPPRASLSIADRPVSFRSSRSLSTRSARLRRESSTAAATGSRSASAAFLVMGDPGPGPAVEQHFQEGGAFWSG